MTKRVYVVLGVSWASYCHFVNNLKYYLPEPLIYMVCDLVFGGRDWGGGAFGGSITVGHGAFLVIGDGVTMGHGACRTVWGGVFVGV